MDTPVSITELAERIKSGHRRSLAAAFSLLESTSKSDSARASELLQMIYQQAPVKSTRRIAVSGAPGAGKSTLLEAYGLALANQGMRVAVLAIDPSSARTGGSILADKVRMNQLADHDAVFIRPSPSRNALGGVNDATRNAILLSEFAGYDVVIVETVGVGQSEIAASSMVDLFVLLVLPTAGDELQGVKRGIMEVTDVILVTKSDIDLEAARRAAARYTGSSKLLTPLRTDWTCKTVTGSSLEPNGLDAFIAVVDQFFDPVRSESIALNRHRQRALWFDESLTLEFNQLIKSLQQSNATIGKARHAVLQGAKHPAVAAAEVVERISISIHDDGSRP
ncbi:MAG: methylmalonyl Co-A mutase-associated GTPase MeaB [Bradyrhizobiaceae bacterium]|nr:methylmalonyl Co-A mutase-associated GTPase MeaB [Bradyrhizobiaceae bacterium]